MTKRMQPWFFRLFVMLTASLVSAAGNSAPLPGFMTPRPPVIDGILDEEIWKSAQKLSGLKTFKPDFGRQPSQRTEVLLAHDRNNIYVAFQCFDRDPSGIKSSITKRDNIFSDDLIGVIFDTFRDNQSGYGFVVNPQGIQGDGMMDSGGDLDPSADFVWFSRGRIHDGGYAVECRIPATSIRFPAGGRLVINVMVIRQIVRTSEMAVFPEVPAGSAAFLSHAVAVEFSGLKYRRVVEILPAFTHFRSREMDAGVLAPARMRRDISLTTKLGLSAGLTLDAAVNPDFSQVEADAGQVDVNLRHGLYYNEKRPFFLEGMEAFRFAGNTEEAPLYAVVHTRNIADPIYGFKLSGKISRHDALAVIVARDQLDPHDEGPANADFAILRYRHAFAGDSYLGGFLTSRGSGDGFNRVAGADGRFRITPSSYTEFHLLGSVSRPGDGGEIQRGHAMALNYNFSSRHAVVIAGVQDIARDFRIDSGFLTRDGLTRLGAFAMYRFYPKSAFFQRIEPFYWSYHIYDKYSGMVETFNLFTLRFHLPRSTSVRFDLIAGNEVFAARRFGRNAFGVQMYSQVTRKLYLQLVLRRGGAVYYDQNDPFGGKSTEVVFGLDYQPTDRFTSSLSLRYADFFRRSDGEKEYDCLILRSRNTLQVNKYFFLRAISEYNTYHRRLVLDFLASFTYIPGTVVHLGYGAAFDRLRWEYPEYVEDNRFLERERGFFFKVSYLWRF